MRGWVEARLSGTELRGKGKVSILRAKAASKGLAQLPSTINIKVKKESRSKYTRSLY